MACFVYCDSVYLYFIHKANHVFSFLDSFAKAHSKLRKLECDQGASSTAEENRGRGKRLKFPKYNPDFK